MPSIESCARRRRSPDFRPSFRRQQFAQLVGPAFQYRIGDALEPCLEYILLRIPLERDYQFAPERVPLDPGGDDPRWSLHAPERADDSELRWPRPEYFCNAWFHAVSLAATNDSLGPVPGLRPDSHGSPEA